MQSQLHTITIMLFGVKVQIGFQFCMNQNSWASYNQENLEEQEQDIKTFNKRY